MSVEPPVGRTVTEWAVQYGPDAPLTDRQPYMFEKTPLWTEETAKAEADGNPKVVIYSRERTVYADRVTEWDKTVTTTPQPDIDPEDACDCDHPYIGTQMAGEPTACERCGGLIDAVAQARLEALYENSYIRLTGLTDERTTPSVGSLSDAVLALHPMGSWTWFGDFDNAHTEFGCRTCRTRGACPTRTRAQHSFEGSTSVGAPCDVCDRAITHEVHPEATQARREFLSGPNPKDD